MHSPHHIRWLTEPPKPGRQYAFGKRSDRRRMAMRLAAGWGPEAVALVERTDLGAVRALLRDDGFERLVTHYRELSEITADERLVRLTDLAFAILTDALEAGDIRVALFFFAQRLEGLEPARTLAEAVVREFTEAALAPPEPPPERAARIRVPPPPPPPAGPDDPRPPGEAHFPYCVATLRDSEAAVALAVKQAGQVRQLVYSTFDRLRRRMVNESEREGTITASADPVPTDQTLATAAALYAECAHYDGAKAIDAGCWLMDRWEGRAYIPPAKMRASLRYPTGPIVPAYAARPSGAVGEGGTNPLPHPPPQGGGGPTKEAAGAGELASAREAAEGRGDPDPARSDISHPPRSGGEPAPALSREPAPDAIRGEGRGSDPPPKRHENLRADDPAWLDTISPEYLGPLKGLPEHERTSLIARLARMYGIAWEPPDTG